MPTWGDHPVSGRRHAHRKGPAGRRRTDRGRHRAGGCRGIAIGVALGCALWAAVLVPLIVWGPL